MELAPVAESSPQHPRAAGLIAWCLILVSVALGYYSLVPPSAVSADAPGEVFSADRAMVHVVAIAGRPHPMGTTAIEGVRGYLGAEINALGLVAELQSVSAPDYFGSGQLVDVVNVAATIPGSSSTGSIVLMAHYDTDPDTPGANDNSAGVATVLEVGRALLAGPTLRNDIVLLFTDSEEPAPRYGSRAFVAENPLFADVALVVNLEALGGSGPSMLIETSGPTAWLVERYAAEVPSPTAFSFADATAALIGEIGTDFDPFSDAGVAGFHFAYLRGSPIYHSPADDVDSVSRASLQHHGSNAFGVARHFGDVDLASMPDSSTSVYFPLRPFFVHYAAAWSIVIAVVAAGLLLLGIARRPAQTGLPLHLALSGGIALLLTLAATLASTLVWILITVLRPTPTVPESYVYLAGVCAVGVILAYRLDRRAPPGRRAGRYGFVLVWICLGLLTALVAPGFSALFTLPALLGAVAMNWDAGDQTGSALIRFGMVAVPTVVLLVPAVDFFFQMGQPRPGNPDSSIPSVAGVGFLLVMLAWGLVWTVWMSPAFTRDGAIGRTGSIHGSGRG